MLFCIPMYSWNTFFKATFEKVFLKYSSNTSSIQKTSGILQEYLSIRDGTIRMTRTQFLNKEL